MTGGIGCDRAWHVYEQVELGKPIPETLPLAAKDAAETSDQRIREHFLCEVGVWPVPLSWGVHRAPCERIHAGMS